jgi:hypothetical protein
VACLARGRKDRFGNLANVGLGIAVGGTLEVRRARLEEHSPPLLAEVRPLSSGYQNLTKLMVMSRFGSQKGNLRND